MHMHTIVRTTTFVLAGMLALAGAARGAEAQYYQAPSFDARPVHFGLSGGVAVPTGAFSNDFNAGWNVGGNVAIPLGYKSPFWIQLDVNHSEFGANDALLANFGATNGWASMTSATANLVINLVQSRGRRPTPITPYLIGGGGFYSRYVELNNSTVNSFCSPFFGCGFFGSSNVVATRTTTTGGWDAGGGFRINMAPVQLFIEARYNSAITDHSTTGFVPISIGVEW
jgi:hypothetical protein